MAAPMKRVLVTGGAGFIGSHLVDALADSQVIVLDDLSTGNCDNLNAARRKEGSVEFVEGDIRDRALVASLMSQVDMVFHLACRGVRHSIGNPLESHLVNAEGTLVLLQEASNANVGRFIHVSTSEVYGTARTVPMDENHPCFPETVYGAAKLAGECYARAYHQTYGFPTIVVRPFNNFGPRSHYEGDSGEVIPRFIVWALNGQAPVIFGDGSQTRDFLFVKDTAYWLTKVAQCDELVGETINLATGRETSVAELAQVICQQIGTDHLKPIFAEARPGDVHRHCAGTSKAQQAIGFHPRTSLADGIREVIDYLRAHPDGVAELLQRVQTVNWRPAA